MAKTKNLSNPYSTGGGGGHFEAAVQACFVTLLLTGGYAPCMARWPIVEIKLQGKVEGFETDDFVAFIEDPLTQERRRLLGQIKHAVAFTTKSAVLGEVLGAAWSDYNNGSIFTRGRDSIALLTGPLSAVDQVSIRFLLEQARACMSAAEFYRKVTTANFSPPKAAEKLAAIEFHLKTANDDVDLTRDQVLDFLRHYHVIDFDLDNDAGISLALLHSHMYQLDRNLPEWAWGRIVDLVQKTNRAAGTITADSLPEDLRKAFERRAPEIFPIALQTSELPTQVDWSSHVDAGVLAVAVLIGSWDERHAVDIREVSSLLGLDYSNWLSKARDLLHAANSPLSVQNGRWAISDRAALLKILGSRLFDQDLDAFRDAAVRILSERDPAFDLPPEERYAASIHGNVPQYSAALRKGIAEGLALLGTQSGALTHCSSGNSEATAFAVVRDLLTGADGVLWGSLNQILPILAEASPSAFLTAVEAALVKKPCPFDELFAQESAGILGRNYMTGLLWALEGLAWEPEYLVRVIVVLGDLASHDPGGNWNNRPANSIATILLPWLPQTLAEVDKRIVAARTLVIDQPEVGWNALLQLLPDRRSTSMGTHRPEWRKPSGDMSGRGVSRLEYLEQVSAYAELLLSAAGTVPQRLAELATHLSNLPENAFSGYLERLSSAEVKSMPEAQRSVIWTALTRFTRKHRRFSDATWALPADRIVLIESVADLLAPTSPFERARYLFDENGSELFEERGNWESQRVALDERRERAIVEMREADGLDALLSFVDSVRFPRQVGLALGAVGDDALDRTLLPTLLAESNGKRRQMVDGYIWRRFQLLEWEWADSLISQEGWSGVEKARLLAELPFDEPVWTRAEAALGSDLNRYWKEVSVSPYQTGGDLSVAIDKLLGVQRPHAAIECLAAQLENKKEPRIEQIVRALLDAVSSVEAETTIDTHSIVELIKYLQMHKELAEDELFKVEWAYLPLLDSHGEGQPTLLERRLATDPAFFSEVIRVLYRSRTQEEPREELSAESKAIASNAWRLLHGWRMPPGLRPDGSFSGDELRSWLTEVRSLCQESGRLEVAMIQAGEVLIHAPPDAGGLWIDRSVAEELNARDAQELRDGFSTALFNSRGAHFVDPTGRPERDLAEQYRLKADAVESAGFSRFAVALRQVADFYEREARRIIDSHERAGSNGSSAHVDG